MKQLLQIKNSMRVLFCSLVCMIFFFSSKGFGQSFSGTYPFTNVTTSSGLTDPTPVPTATGVTFSSFTATGYTGNPNAGSRFSFTGSPLAGNAPTSSGNATCVCNGSVNTGFYYQVSVTVSSGYTVNLSSITFTIQRSGTGIRQYSVRSNADSYAANIFASVNSNSLLTVVPTNVFQIDDSATTAQTGSTVTLSGANFTGLTAGTTRTFRFYGWNAEAAGGSFSIDDVVISGTATALTPTITGSATTSAFTTTYGTSSATQSFPVSGTNLTANLVATAPTNFEVSSDGTTYGSTATYTQSSGSASGTLYIRLKATAPVSGTYNSQSVILSSTGATSVNITTPSSGNAASPATLIITAGNQSVSFGDSVASVLAAGSYTPSGFVNGENASVISGSVSYTTTYTDTTPAGTTGVTISPVVTSLSAANYTFSAANGAITIASAPVPVITSALTFSAQYGTAASTYTITATNSPTSFSATGLPSGLTLNGVTGAITGTPTAVPGDYNVSISATNGGGTGSNQTLVYTITAKPLTITGAVADNKIYDRTNAATISGSTLVGVVSGDVVTVSNTGTFASTLVANGIVVTSTQTLGGTDASKYSLTLPTDLTANITAKPLTINGATAQNKQFDGTNTATLTGTLSGVVSPDVVTLTLNGVFASSAVGNNIAVTSTSTIGGANAGNYTLTQPTGLTANITQAIVPLLQWNTFGNVGTETTQTTSSFGTNMTASTLNYSGSTVVPAANSNRFGGTWGTVANVTSDKYIQFTATPATGYMFTPTSFTFIWDYSGTGPKSVALRSSVDGFASDLGTLTFASTSTSIFRTINITGLTGLTGAITFRIYGYGSTGGTGGFDCASSQNNVVLNGYTEAAPPPTIATSGTLTALTTTYGTASSTTSFNVSGTYMQGGILVTPPTGYEVSLSSGSGFAATVTVGAAGTISSTPVYVRLKANATAISSPYTGDIVLSSTNATSVNVATVSSTVTPKTLTVSGLTASNKVYDGNTNATLTGTGSLVGVINSDVVSLDGTPVGTFVSSAIGTAITINVTGYSISGAGSGNYTLTLPTLSADISSMPTPVINSTLTASATYGIAATTYTITATETPTSFNATGLPAGLSIDTNTGAITGTPTALPDVYSVTISATNAGGTGTATLSYTILAKPLTITGATADNKIYNKTNAATISGSTLVGVVGADDVTVSNTGTFVSVLVANGIVVNSTQTLGGADANKYSLILPTGLTANITPKPLTVSAAAAQNKQYDGTTAATITGTLSGVITTPSADNVVLNGTGIFASSAIGNNIAVTSTATLSGTDAGNYTLTQPTGLTANITPPVIYLNQFTGVSACPTNGNTPVMATNATGTALTRSTLTCTTAANVFNSTTINNTASVSNSSYIEFSATAAAGKVLNVTSLSFFRQASATAPNQLEVRYSTDGFTTYTTWGSAPLTPTTGTVATWDFTDFTTQIAGTVTFRIYPYGTQRADLTAGAASTGSFRLDDVTIYGTVSAPTPPSASVISGSTSICNGDSAVISVAITGGQSPYSLVYSDGTNNFTESSYSSGANILVTPSATTTYTIVSVTDSNSLLGSGNSGSATITLLPNLTYYRDADGDGYGNPAISAVSCALSVPGYVTNNTDCNDNNAAMHTTYTFYTDADADGYGDVAASAQVLCAANASTPPSSNLSRYNTDCDETRANVHPNAPDTCYDGLDNDCDGNIDNVGQPGGCVPIVSTLLPSSCGVTLAALDTPVYSTLVANAQGYRWRITKMINGLPSTNPSDVQSIDTQLRTFRFTQLTTYAFDTAYKVEVSVKLNGVWQPFYSNPCTVRTPATTTQVAAAQCGGTLALMTDAVYANIVSYTTGYRFKITNLLNTNEVQIIDRSLRAFQFSLLNNISFNTPYKVEVAIRNTDGVTYLPYGPACTVTTPSFPTTALQNSQCDYVATSPTELIYANLVSNATAYRFNITNSASGYSYTLDKPLRVFQLNTIPGLSGGTTYTVQVAVQIGGIFGPYGKACTVTTPVALNAKSEAVAAAAVSPTATFEAMAVPNPFAENFKLEVQTSSDALIHVKVYDMLGNLLESREVTATDIPALEVGANYPSGVYHVIVTQEDRVKTLRMIKR